jgi:hypothetical protein
MIAVMDCETKSIIITVLQQQKAIVQYSKRQHEWITALVATMSLEPSQKASLEAHPSFDLGRAPALQMLELAAENIDTLIQQLKVR